MGMGWTSLKGFIQALPMWKSIQYTFDSIVMSMEKMVEVAKDIEESVGNIKNIAKMEFNSPLIEMPLCWEHSEIKRAIEKYLQGFTGV